MTRAANDQTPTIEIDPDRRLVRQGDQPVDLGSRAFELLAALAERAGRTVAPDDLIAAAWPGRDVEPSNLRVQINNLRKALGRDKVVNVPGQGYRLVGPVRYALAGPSPEVAARLQRLQNDAMRELAARRGVGPQVLAALAGRLALDVTQPIGRARDELESAIELAAQLMQGDRDAAPADSAAVLLHPELTRAALVAAAHATRAGQLDQATLPLDDALAELQRREQEHAEALRRTRRALLQAMMQQHRLRRDAEAVAACIESLVVLDEPVEPTASAAWLAQERHHLAEAERRLPSLAPDIAAALAARRAAAAKTPLARAAALCVQADALLTRGLLRVGPQDMQAAADVAHTALQGLSRSTEPAAWAQATVMLASALHDLGRRSSRRETLEEALASADAALQVLDAATDAVAWANAHHARAGALLWLGAADADSARLLAALESCDRALEVRSPERGLHTWVRTRHQRGTVLSHLANREAGTARRREAVAHHRQTLARLPAEEAAADWATVQNLLGIDLMLQGREEGSVEHLRAAAEVFRTLLERVGREDGGALWSYGQHNLGMVLARLGTLQRGAPLLREAIEAYRLALEEHTVQAQPRAHAAGQNEVAEALLHLAALLPPAQARRCLEEAETALHASLALRPKNEVPLDWARSHADLARVCAARLPLGGTPSDAQAAVRAAEAALQVADATNAPVEHGRAIEALEAARTWLAQAAAG